jgi:hypothetical protein
MVVAQVSKVRVAAEIRTTPGVLKMKLVSTVDLLRPQTVWRLPDTNQT